ncbi:hypothetical protein HL658_20230 [Azospirillum sp. RWY-5-1]|uniref:Uncharacterized protein n=1 Tax=Azospirillum oleiclasticum TaxID=2735135 RepID=A0ABX2TD88_9PROT|nr:hypothetical protein [Azospirillum oleiclasticum]NYZ22134.1 hypothetical protein [Azospirillum oleiclasticum]
MITIEDCIGLSGLSEEEIDAIAEHEHLPEIVAAELGNYLVGTAAGQEEIRRMIEDDIAEARAHGRPERAAVLNIVLCHFLNEHRSADTMKP